MTQNLFPIKSNKGLSGFSISGLPLRTRSKIIKQKICEILGFDHYYGMTEYNNDADFDGVWGIWDHKFFQYMNKTLSEKKKPFFATVFSVSSHAPFQVPKELKNQFKEGNVPLHKCIRYTDYSLKKFFESASKEKWFNNTIFVFTGDHCNQIYYEEYFFLPVEKLFEQPATIHF